MGSTPAQALARHLLTLESLPRLRGCGGRRRKVSWDDAMVHAVELRPRHVYCSSPHSIAALVKLGWRLSDAAQLTALVKELTAAPDDRTHDPADHLQ